MSGVDHDLAAEVVDRLLSTASLMRESDPDERAADLTLFVADCGLLTRVLDGWSVIDVRDVADRLTLS